MKDDLLIAQPTNPGPNSSVTWISTEDGTFEDFAGFLGDLFFDQEVTVLVQTWADAGTPRTMNNGGQGDVIPANTPTPIRVGFLGANTLIKIVTGDDAPTVWHANGRMTRGALGGPATGTVAYGVPPNSPGPKGDPGPANVAGDLSVGGVAVIETELVVGGPATVAGDFEATSNALVIGNLTVGGGLGTDGAVTVGNGIDLNGGMVVNSGDFAFTDGAGSRLGTSPTEKLALWGATPRVQPTSQGVVAGFTAGVGDAVLVDSTSTGGIGTTAYTYGDIVKMLKQAGIAPL
jgi:hypothetical protein